MLKKKWIFALPVIVACFFIYGVVPSNDEQHVEFSSGKLVPNTELFGILKKEAERRFVPALDARIDRVWKAIPGLDGVAVDMDQSLRASIRGWRERRSFHIIYKRVKPLVQLKDLPPSPIYRGNPNKPAISFMVNVAWGDEYIPSILRTLAQSNVKATFFLDGSWLQINEQLAIKMKEGGHELANHAYSHQNMSMLSDSRQESEIARTEKLLNRLGISNRLFAPPSGDFNQRTVEIANRLGLRTILWTIDTVDWRNPSDTKVISKVEQLLEPGSLILMHPTAVSARTLPTLIRIAQKKNMVVCTVSQLLDSARVPSNNIE